MAEGTSEESYEAIFLIDGSAIGSSSRATSATCSAHHLDDAERLVACCQQVQERCPSARLRAFVNMEGESALSLGGDRAASLQNLVQWVPLGCDVLDFLLEFARKRASKGQRVNVVSNARSAIDACRDANFNHLGFMFVDGELLMPGLQRTMPNREPGATMPRGRAPEATLHGGRSRTRSPRRLRTGTGSPADSHTLHDSELDGESMEEFGALGDTQIDEEPSTARFRGLRAAPGDHIDLSFAETQVVEDFAPPTPEAVASAEVKEQMVDTQPEGSQRSQRMASQDSKASAVSWGDSGDADTAAGGRKWTEESFRGT